MARLIFCDAYEDERLGDSVLSPQLLLNKSGYPFLATTKEFSAILVQADKKYPLGVISMLAAKQIVIPVIHGALRDNMLVLGDIYAEYAVRCRLAYKTASQEALEELVAELRERYRWEDFL